MCAISGTDEAICLQCKCLLDLRSIFDSFVHSGRDLKRHKAIYLKPAGKSYANVKELKTALFVYLYLMVRVTIYHQNCVRHNTINHHNRTTLVAAYKTCIHCL